MQLHYPLDPNNNFTENSALQWTNGNPSIGASGSFPGFEPATYSMQEIINVITAAGIVPSDADLTQLLEAIRQLISGSIPAAPGATINGGLQLDTSNDFLINLNNLVEDDTPQAADLFLFENVASEIPVKITWTKLIAAISAQITGGGNGTPGQTGGNGQNGTNGTNIQLCVSNSNSVGIQSSVATQVAHWGSTSNTFTTSTFDGQYFTVGTGEDGYYLITSSASFNLVCYDIGWEVTLNGVRTGIRSGNGSEAQASAGASVAGVRHLNVGDKIGMYCYLETGGANRTFSACNFAISRIRGN